ncbi:MAG TPA: DUF5329 family protein [Burkholderiaceae bacterium]|nr:DUF5329 family protein [Burkholderiaceae bacterium]
MIDRRLVLALIAALPLAARAEPPPAELARINRLIDAVATHKELRFIRNGSDYSADDAAEFMRKKLANAYYGRNVNTVNDFIDQIATRSSTSGELYMVKLSDGRSIPCSEFLRLELARIEAKR